MHEQIPVAVTCRVLKVSTSGYYDWLGNKELTKMIREILPDPAAATDHRAFTRN